MNESTINITMDEGNSSDEEQQTNLNMTTASGSTMTQEGSILRQSKEG